MMKKILDIPYYSQHRDVKDEYWRKRSCSIVCLKMILNYYLETGFPNNSSTIEDLIKEGVYIGGLNKNRDWIQDRIVMLACNHGVHAYRQEFKSMKIDVQEKRESESEYSKRMLDEGLGKIIRKLKDDKPVLVSVGKRFQDENKFHLIVLTGFETENGEAKGFYYNDTDYQDEKGKNLFVDIDTFKKYWRKLAIFIL